jgi:hypothetical protein
VSRCSNLPSTERYGDLEDLDLVINRMKALFEEYERYDLTIDILAAWKYYFRRFFPEAGFGCVCDIGSTGSEGEYRPSSCPDFVVQFEHAGYAAKAEIKASLSVGPDSLQALCDQVTRYSAQLNAIRASRTGGHVATPRMQDVMVLVPAAAAASVATFLRTHLPKPEHGQHVTLVQFVIQEEPRVLSFSQFPLGVSFEGLRDGFLPDANRISAFLATRIELHLERYEVFRRYLIANSDGVLSSLGVTLRVLEAAKDIYGSQLARHRYGDNLDPPPLRFTVEDLHDRLMVAPYECGVSQSELRDLLKTLARSAPFLSLDSAGSEVVFSLRPSRRFSPFSARAIQERLPAKYAGSERLLYAYHMARGLLIAERTTQEALHLKSPGQLPLFPGLA